MALRGIVRVSMWFAVLVIVMFASQLVIPYHDWFADVVPENIRLTTFTIAYPVSYGSPYYKANGWIGLEPSVVSFQLGVALVAGVLIRATHAGRLPARRGDPVHDGWLRLIMAVAAQ